jgi:hypothetical protein
MLRSRIQTIALAITLAACSSTSVDTVWQSPVAQPPLHNVVTMFQTNNLTMRHAGEDRIAQALQAQGVRATPSYLLLGDGKVSVDAAKAAVTQLGYDGVVTMRVVDREQAVEYYPATIGDYWGGWGGYWGPGDYYWGAYTYEIYKLETAAYSLKSGQLVWSVLTTTVDPSSARKLLNSTTKHVAQELTRRGLVG